MAITITDNRMDSDLTPHRARAGQDGWEVSWLPGRVLDRNQATTAMTLAETVAGGPTERMRPFIDSWAGELGLSGQDAVTLILGREMESS